MTRRHCLFECEGARLAGTLDAAEGRTGLLIVSGGNETRSGPFDSQAELALALAHAGHPVFRFDRRGVGDSEGHNGGFESSAPDIRAAADTFRALCPTMERIVGFGNCDGASALALMGGAGLDGLVLANLWTFEPEGGDEAPPAAVRAHYRQRLTDPTAIARLLRGKVSLRRLVGALGRAARSSDAPGNLVTKMHTALGAYPGPVRFLVADRDRTGQAFRANWPDRRAPVAICKGATHGFAEADARAWLRMRVLEALDF